jgi:hypothetical protein
LGLTGRYDFKGIQKAGERLIDALLAGTGWGAWLLASPFMPAIRVIEGLLINYLTNRGLIIIDVAAVIVNGKIDEARLTSALNSAFEKLKVGRDKITPAEGAKIDAETTEAFDEFADVPMANGVSNVPGKTL